MASRGKRGKGGRPGPNSGAAKASKGGKTRNRQKGRSGGGSRGRGRTTRQPDPSDTPDSDVRFIQPYEAVKSYQCPGCNGEIPPGQGHMVAIPPDAPDLRRHWHRGCWVNRQRRY